MTILLLILSISFPLAALVALSASFVLRNSLKPFNYGFLFGVVLSVLAFGIEATIEADLTRYVSFTRDYTGLSFFESFNSDKAHYAGYVVFSSLSWLAAHIGPPELIKSIMAFLIYFPLLYIVCDYCSDNQFGKGNRFIAILAVLCFVPLFNAVSAARSSPALALSLLAVYRDLYQNKRDVLTYLLYILPIGIHTSSLVFILTRVLVIFTKRSRLTTIVASIALLPATAVFGDVLAPVTNYFGTNILALLQTYLGWKEGYAEAVRNSTFMTLLRWVNYIILLAFIIRFIFTKNQVIEHIGEQNRLILFFCVINLSIILTTAIMIIPPSYMRFTYSIYVMTTLCFLKIKDVEQVEGSLNNVELFVTRLSSYISMISGLAAFILFCAFFLNYVAIDKFLPGLFFGLFSTV